MWDLILILPWQYTNIQGSVTTYPQKITWASSYENCQVLLSCQGYKGIIFKPDYKQLQDFSFCCKADHIVLASALRLQGRQFLWIVYSWSCSIWVASQSLLPSLFGENSWGPPLFENVTLYKVLFVKCYIKLASLLQLDWSSVTQLGVAITFSAEVRF